MPSSREALIVPARGAEGEQGRVRCGIVVARGRGEGRPREVRVGDVIVFPAGLGQGLRLRLNGREHVLVREQDALAIIEEAATADA